MIIRVALAAALALLAAPLAVGAQQPTNVARIGYLGSGSPEWPQTRAVLDAVRQGLRERGYVEGQNIRLGTSMRASGRPFVIVENARSSSSELCASTS